MFFFTRADKIKNKPTNHRTKMQKTNLFLMLCLVCGLCACRRLEYGAHLEEELDEKNAPLLETLEKESEERKLRSEVMSRFSYIRKLIAERKLDKAEESLAEMRSLTDYSEDVKSLQELIELARKLSTDTTELAIDRQLILQESTDEMKLPSKYDTYVQVDAPAMPENPHSNLEILLDQKVSMRISNMPLDEFAMQLGTLDGLNIADPLNVIFSNETMKSKTFSANFKDVPLKEVFAYISRNLKVDFNVVDNLIWVTAAANEDTGVPLETRIIPLRQGIIPKVPEGIGVSGQTAFTTTAEDDDDLESALKSFYEKTKTGGSYKLFRTRNMLLVNDTRANIHRVEELVKILDKPPYQVLIEARFMTVSQKDLRDVGVELKNFTDASSSSTSGTATKDDLKNNKLSFGNFLTELGAIQKGNPDGIGSLTISGILGNRSFDVVLSAIENKTSTVTISAPRITTLNNRTARIRKGDKRYYFEQYNLQTVDLGDNKGKDQMLVPVGKPTAMPLGITFDVKPSVGNDGQTILLGLKPEIITFEDWEDYTSSESKTVDKTTTTYQTQVKLPRTHEQTIAASVAINSGETVILGGMVENVHRTSVKKIPFLGDIPLIGFLFRHTEEIMEPSNLLIFVTATVINEQGEYVIISE